MSKDLRTDLTLYASVVHRSLGSIIISLGMTKLWIADHPVAQASQIQGNREDRPYMFNQVLQGCRTLWGVQS